MKEKLIAVLQEQAEAKPLALCRIGIGLASVWQARHTYYYLQILYFDVEIVRAKQFSFLPDIPLEHIDLYCWLWSFLSFAFAAGLFTTGSGVLLSCVIGYSIVLDQNLYSNHVYLLVLLIILLTIGQSGKAYSYDAYRRGRAGDHIPYFPWFLIRFQMSVVYCYAGLSKLNPNYTSGTVIQSALFFGDRLPPPVVEMLVWVSIMTELFLAFGLWSKYTQRKAFVIGSLLHVSIPILMFSEWQGLSIFSIICVSTYVLFLHREPKPGLVVWDDQCSFCMKTVRLLKLLDWLSAYEFVGSSAPSKLQKAGISPAEADVELKLKTGGKILGGFDAVREILCNLPATFLIAPLLSLPGIRDLGHRTYRAVAIRRKCRLRSLTR